MKLPTGFRAVYNRMKVPYEQFFDGVPQTFAPGETRVFPFEAAEFLTATSVVKVSLQPDETGRLPVTRALVLDDDPNFEKPLGDIDTTELLDRSECDTYGGKRAPEGKTKATLIPVSAGSGLKK